MIEHFEELCGILLEPFEKLAESLNEFMYELEYVIPKKKAKHRPVLTISPNKIYLRDKRSINHYCRNNC